MELIDDRPQKKRIISSRSLTFHSHFILQCDETWDLSQKSSALRFTSSGLVKFRSDEKRPRDDVPFVGVTFCAFSESFVFPFDNVNSFNRILDDVLGLQGIEWWAPGETPPPFIVDFIIVDGISRGEIVNTRLCFSIDPEFDPSDDDLLFLIGMPTVSPPLCKPQFEFTGTRGKPLNFRGDLLGWSGPTRINGCTIGSSISSRWLEAVIDTDLVEVEGKFNRSNGSSSRRWDGVGEGDRETCLERHDGDGVLEEEVAEAAGRRHHSPPPWPPRLDTVSVVAVEMAHTRAVTKGIQEEFSDLINRLEPVRESIKGVTLQK